MENRYMEEQLRTHKTFPLLLKLAIPAVAAQVLNALYNLVDRMFIGHMGGEGTLALSGLGICFPIISLVTAFAWLVGMGGAPLLSISLGEKKEEDAARIESNAFLMLLLIGVTLTVFCFFFARPVLILFGASDKILPYAVTYLRIYVLGSTAVMIAGGMNSFINAQGHTALGTVTIAIGALLNIFLDFLFISVLHMGIRGAAIATVIAQIISALWVMQLLFFSDRIGVKIKIKYMALRISYVRRILALGVSSFVFMANESLVGVVLNRLIRRYEGYGDIGDLYISALTIVVSMSQLFFMPLQGITQGAQPMVGYCKGAKDYDRISETVRDGKILGIISATAFWVFFMFAPRLVASIFTKDAALIELSEGILRISFWECPLFGIQMLNQHMFVAMGNAKYSFIFAIMRKVLLLIPIACILPVFMGVNGVFLAESVSTVITVIVTQIAYTHYMKLQRKEMLG